MNDLHNDGAPPRAHTYPVPTARVLDDSERNQLAGLRHEACEHHCESCGACDWRPTGPTTDEAVPGMMVGDHWYCTDCIPDTWLPEPDPSTGYNPGDCIEWTLGRDKDGYGFTSYDGRKIAAHRRAYILHHGLTTADIIGLVVMHTCDNPPCVNPNHLVLGTGRDNIDDMIAKGRSLRGERNHQAVLTSDQVQAIRDAYASAERVTQTELARQYGVTQQQISHIILNKTWKES